MNNLILNPNKDSFSISDNSIPDDLSDILREKETDRGYKP
jgi:hypothetical protein